MNKSHQEIVETQLDVAELAIGMHVVRLDRPWEETDFLIQGFVIKDQSDIEALRAQCGFVFIEGRVQKTNTVHEEPTAIRNHQDCAGFSSANQHQNRHPKNLPYLVSESPTSIRSTLALRWLRPGSDSRTRKRPPKRSCQDCGSVAPWTSTMRAKSSKDALKACLETRTH